VADGTGTFPPGRGEIDYSTLSDRQLLLLLLTHVQKTAAQVEAMHQVLEEFRPLLAKFSGPGARAVAGLTARRGMRWQ
jgi:hypothetical protein